MRHPLDVAYSIWKRGWHFQEETGELLTDTCRYVKTSVEAQLSFLRAHPSRSHVLHYDRLVETPMEETRSLCQFLEEPWSDEMIRHHEQSHDFGTEDPIARGTKGFRGSYENWRAWDAAQKETAIDILKPLIEEVGYTIQSPFAQVEKSDS